MTLDDATLALKDLLAWSAPSRVETRRGERWLRRAEPTPEFWDLWGKHRRAILDAGFSVGKSKLHQRWEVCWWAAFVDDFLAQPAGPTPDTTPFTAGLRSGAMRLD